MSEGEGGGRGGLDGDVGDGSTSRPRAVVAGHGEFAAGIVSAVAQIAGLGELFVPLSNRGLALPELEQLLRREVDSNGARVIFTDLPAGSWTIAARRVMRDRPGVSLVAGANLAALLDFACRADHAASDAARQAMEKGRAALLLVEGSHGR